jgi:hypothetical protein
MRSVFGNTQFSDEVLQLVETVERLGITDQERMLRLVRLLAIMPRWTQGTTQTRLKRLVDSNPSVIGDDVDEFIEYLEDSILNDFDLAEDEEPLAYGSMSGLPN